MGRHEWSGAVSHGLFAALPVAVGTFGLSLSKILHVGLTGDD
jgi:hypothetical protein